MQARWYRPAGDCHPPRRSRSHSIDRPPCRRSRSMGRDRPGTPRRRLRRGARHAAAAAPDRDDACRQVARDDAGPPARWRAADLEGAPRPPRVAVVARRHRPVRRRDGPLDRRPGRGTPGTRARRAPAACGRPVAAPPAQPRRARAPDLVGRDVRPGGIARRPVRCVRHRADPDARTARRQPSRCRGPTRAGRPASARPTGSSARSCPSRRGRRSRRAAWSRLLRATPRAPAPRTVASAPPAARRAPRHRRPAACRTRGRDPLLPRPRRYGRRLRPSVPRRSPAHRPAHA